MDKKELIKTITLLTLVSTSIFLSYAITNYKPTYDILTREVDEKTEENLERQKRNSINLLSPSIIVQNKATLFQEKSETTIIKGTDTPVVKDRQVINQILSTLSTKEIDYSRIRNHSIREVIDQSKTYYTMEYQESIDSVSAKLLYFANGSNQNSSLVFDRVMISDFNKNSVYLYSTAADSYMQVFFKEDIYSDIEVMFSSNAKEVHKYFVGEKEMYIEKDISSYKIDEYDIRTLGISEVAGGMFDERTGVKVNDIGDGFKEATDGFAILRENESSVIYINPSNSNNNTLLKNNEVQVLATNELIKGYLPDAPYSISDIQKNEIKFRENYNSLNVYAGDYPAQISALVTSTGVHRLVIPKIERSQLVSSKEPPVFHMENIDAIMNYLYQNLNVKDIENIELAYEKKYDSNLKRMTYSPTWYIRYQNQDYTFQEIKDKFKKE
ncbi:MAG: hypothetical protein Q3988_05220 [Gemella sp.]|nr:hypothetical protein [Gemella sp.]